MTIALAHTTHSANQPCSSFQHNKPYRPLSQHYQELFGAKVFKVSVSVAETCPNRQGLNGMKVCVFCDQWGSAAYHLNAHQPLDEQFAVNSRAIRERYRAERFLVYFQAYTNTFGRVRQWAETFQSMLQEPDVVGIVVGTRPDCLPSGMLKVLDKIRQTHFVGVELGVQTLDEEQLRFLSRGHTAQSSLEAIHKLVDRGIDVCVHLMFGLPGESDTQLIQTASTLSDLRVDGVKLHNLHVLRNTPLETLYQQGDFVPVGLEDYAWKVCKFLEHLNPQIAVHRLNAVASRWDELVAPAWTKEKMRPTQFIENFIIQQGSWQGKYYPDTKRQSEDEVEQEFCP